jgi:hypothetical protein
LALDSQKLTSDVREVDLAFGFDVYEIRIYGGMHMQSRWRIAASAVAAVISTGATIPAPTAIVTVAKGYDKGSGLDGTGTAQFYDISEANQCKGRRRIAKFSWITGAEKSKSIPAGKIIYLTAYTNRYTPGGITGAGNLQLNTARCENRGSFTPQSGESYLVLQQVEVSKACSMTVVTKSTNASPPDFVELPQLRC